MYSTLMDAVYMQGQGVVDPESGLTKVVLARRSDVTYRGDLDPLLLLGALQVPSLPSICSTLLLLHLHSHDLPVLASCIAMQAEP